MLEPAIAVVVTALVMLLPLREVNIRRMRAWVARDLGLQTHADYVNTAGEAQDALRQGYEAELAEQARGQEETQQWANRILREHEWHIAGKGNAHGKGVEIQWQCANCPAVVFAPEGAL